VTVEAERKGKAQERNGSLGRLASRKKETPREAEAHEGCGPGFGLNRQAWVRTLTGSKALKWGEFWRSCFAKVGLG